MKYPGNQRNGFVNNLVIDCAMTVYCRLPIESIGIEGDQVVEGVRKVAAALL